MMKKSVLQTFEVTDSNGVIRSVPKWLKDILDRHPRYAFCNTENSRVELFFHYPQDKRIRDAIVEMAPSGRVVGQRVEKVVTVVMSF